ncbi:NTP transferase domain-containing protein [Clostridium sp. 19966]|nr:NTP transferase domain-containing protein [Clostridium sp. 19966]
MLYALILAGGKGTRLFPLSRSDKPKQFLKLINNKSFLRNTVDRIKPMINKENIYVVTNDEYHEKVKEELPEINEENIFVEPANKETPYYRILVISLKSLKKIDLLLKNKVLYKQMLRWVTCNVIVLKVIQI